MGSIGTPSVTTGSSWIYLDAQDIPHILYEDRANDRLLHFFWAGSAWQREVIADDDAFLPVKGAFDERGHLHVGHQVVTRSNGIQIWHAEWDGQVWARERVSQSDGVSRLGGSLAVGSGGTINVLYSPVSGVLTRAFRRSGTWMTEAVGIMSSPSYAQFDIDAQGNWHLVYSERIREGGPGSDAYDVITYSKREGGVWTTVAFGDATDPAPTVALPAMHVADTTQVFFAFKNNITGSIEFISYDARAATSSRRVVDADAGPSWNKPVQLGADAQGNLFLAYHDNGDGDLKVARSSDDGRTWARETVVSQGDAGEWLDMAIDSNGHPHVVYVDGLTQ